MIEGKTIQLLAQIVQEYQDGDIIYTNSPDLSLFLDHAYPNMKVEVVKIESGNLRSRFDI